MALQLLLSGLATGSLYAITALGIVLIFTNTRVINLAQGDFGMMGAFMALMAMNSGLSYIQAIIIAVIGVVVLAVVMQVLVMRWIEEADWLTLFSATLGVYYVLHGVSGLLWGRDTKAFPDPFPKDPVNIFGAMISKGNLMVMAVALLVGAALFLFLKYTNQGIAMRAMKEDRYCASLMGIPIRRVVTLTWVVGGILAAVSGLLLAPIIWVSPGMMDTVLVKGYAAAIFGGMYSMPGAILGALFIGVAENLAGGYFGAEYKVTIAFILIIVILAIKPTGLMGGSKRREI